MEAIIIKHESATNIIFAENIKFIDIFYFVVFVILSKINW